MRNYSIYLLLVVALFICNGSPVAAKPLHETDTPGVEQMSLSPAPGAYWMTEKQPHREIVLVDEGPIVNPDMVEIDKTASLAPALNIAAYGMTLLWVSLGLYHLIKTIRRENKTPNIVALGLINSCSFIMLGVLTPGLMNWCLATAIESNILLQ